MKPNAKPEEQAPDGTSTADASRPSRPVKRACLDAEIHEELDALFHAWARPSTLAEVQSLQARWRALLDKAGGNEALSETDVDDVARLLGWGWALARTMGDHRRAASLLEPFFQHPDFEHANIDVRLKISCDRATSLLYAGEILKAIALYRTLLDAVKERPGHSRSAARRAWSELEEFCLEQPGDESAPAALAELVDDIVRRLRRKLSARHKPREGTTYAELCSLLAMAKRRA